MIYTIKDWLREDENQEYVEESKREALIEHLSEQEDWLYDEGSNLLYTAYEKLYNNMTTTLSSFKGRKMYHTDKD